MFDSDQPMASSSEQTILDTIAAYLIGASPPRSSLRGHDGGVPDDSGGEFHTIQVRKPRFSIDAYLLAFSKFDETANDSKGKKIDMFLDYDGTLSPIVDYPDLTFMTNEKSGAEREFARSIFTGTAIASGSYSNKISQNQLPCPRCDSTHTKFCYYNNYSLSQPRHFCKTCRRYWTHGGQDYPRAAIAAKKFHHKIISASSPERGYGGGSSEGGGGKFHAIQVDEADHHPVCSIANDRQASPVLINTSIASDPSGEPPPPNRPPSVIEIAAENSQEKPEFDLSGLAKIFLSLAAGEGFASLAVRYGTGNPLPENARILLSSGEFCSVAAFLLCSGGYIMERSRRAKLAARLITVGGVVAASCGFVLMMGSILTSD